MANVGVGESYNGYLVKAADVPFVDTLLSQATPIEQILTFEAVHPFRYRYVSDREMTSQPISAWLKGRFESVIYTSEDGVDFSERDKVMLEDQKYKYLTISRIHPQKQNGFFAFSKTPPKIVELA